MSRLADVINPNLPNYPKGYKKYWTIHNKRYDMSLFVDKHPGGRRMILQGQGRNCTEVFESYHSLSTLNLHALLDRFFVEDTPVGAPDWDKSYDWDPNSPGGKFWETLKERVRNHLKRNGQTHKATPIQLVVVLALCAATLTTLSFFFKGYWFSIVLLPLLYFLSGTVGMHDGGHGSLSRFEWVNWLGTIYGSAAISPINWQLRHNVGHHEHTNVKGKDPDLISLTRCVASTGVKKYTVIWMTPSLTTIAMSYINDILFRFLPRNELKILGTFSVTDQVYHYVSRPLFFGMFIVYPFYNFPLLKAIAFVTVPYLIHGLVFYALSQISHFNDQCFEEHERLTPDPVKPPAMTDPMSKHWAVHQLRHTMDWGIPTPYVVGVSVGLCYQTIHHLFPQIYHMNLVSIQPIVEQTCREFGVNYNWVPTVDELIGLYGQLLERYDQGSILTAWAKTQGPVVHCLKWVGYHLGQIHPKGWQQ